MSRVTLVCAAATFACSGGISVESGVDAGAEASRMGAASSLRQCVDVDAGRCLLGCDPGEVCFTDLACSPTRDGGFVCFWPGAAKADDRCRRSCDQSADCAPGEACFQKFFYACGDYNGSPNNPRGVCCAADAGC